MNYPVWDVSFGAGLLIALVAILHVFVSHFAVGGGLYLVLTEARARRNKDHALLEWLKRHTKFFVLVTVVYGAVSGVGIWFTIGLISPTATSNLIHAYVWGWAIEWVFFFLEITAALLYLNGWDRLEPKLHLWYGWIYFIAAYLSLVVINGIITFMLTSGKWTETHEFWQGFFNPTYFPSLFFRTAVAFALAGIYALITTATVKDAGLKARLVRWSALWVVPSLMVLPVLGWWYIRSIPAEVWANARGPMPTGSHYATLAVLLLAATLLLAVIALIRPAKLHIGFSLLLALVALAAMGSFEFVREAVRKPYVIANYLYANSLYSGTIPGDGGFSIDEVTSTGILNASKWTSVHEITPQNRIEAGHEIFRLECQSCHTVDAYRGVKHYLVANNWNEATINQMLGGLNFMHGGVMPSFAGTDAERGALAAYLATLHPVATGAAQPTDGPTVFAQNCAMCHQVKPEDKLFKNLPANPQTAADALKDLTSLFPLMPDLKLDGQQRLALAQWVNAQRAAKGMPAPQQGGN